MRNSRTVRCFVVASLLLGILPTMAAYSGLERIPETLSAAVKVAFKPGTGRLTHAKTLPIKATDLAVTWKGDGQPPLIRTSADGRRWTKWRRLEESVDLYDRNRGLHYSDLTGGGGARWAQARTSGGINNLTLQVINTKDGPRRTVLVPRLALAATGQPAVISRAAWGADESLRKAEPEFSRVRKLFVHHTATANNDADPYGTIRAMQAYHVRVRGWDDLGYNFLIDAKGRIFEGRYSRQYDPGETPSGENRRGFGVIGAHTSGHNIGSAGVALIGDTNSGPPSGEAMDALTSVLAWKADRHGINPRKSDAYRAPSGDSESFANIAGHTDSPGEITSCPGQHLYRALPEVRRSIEQRIVEQSALTPPSMPTGSAISPASPSVDAMPAVSGAVGRSVVRVDVTFTGPGLSLPRTIAVTPSSGSFILSDATYAGAALSAGTYAVRAVAVDAAGRTSPAAPVADAYTIKATELPLLLPLLGQPPLGVPPPQPGDSASNSLAGALEQVLKVLSP